MMFVLQTVIEKQDILSVKCETLLYTFSFYVCIYLYFLIITLKAYI